ncbi:MAG: glycosyltransferase family 4 protein [Flavobacteriales bacterium]|nr:glycosyltransferase family 4 protein [Flavobacteriales bacterium]MBK7940742.1 glycosyltransferase family 4 protein [Flavobacteriales bacterium]MBK9700842.1 glycosyltransferase family 4 protein [Flavobacteriales bacterium]
MHVALCTDGVFPQAMGGMQRHSRLLAEHLARGGNVKLTVLHPHAVGIFDPALGIEEVHLPDIDKHKLYIRELWRYSDRVGMELERIKPDVILSQGFCVWKGIDRFSDRLIIHPHGLEMFQMLTRKERLLGWPFRAGLRYMVRNSAVVISLGGKLTGILQGLAKGSDCRVVVIPNATEVPQVPRDKGQGSSINAGPLPLLFVGRFAFNKGLDVLLAVARRLVAEGRTDLVRFQLAGDGPLLEDLKRDLPPNVALLGRVDDAQLNTLYADCAALILPTRFEGMPTVVLEAMARAKPIIVSDVGASGELVNPHNGYLLPPDDAEALYQAVVAFAGRTAEVRARMGEYSFARVNELFSWPVVVRRFEALFAELVSGARR